MAESVKSYRQGAVFGSLAYDFNNPAVYREPALEPDVPVEPQAAPQTGAVPETRARTAVRTRQALAPVAVVGYACAAVMLIFSLLARVQLTQVSDGVVHLQSQLSELKTEQSKLLIRYESAFNLTDVERYATGVLGMQRPRDDQVCYVDGSSPDKAEVLGVKEDADALTFRLSDFFDSLGEYFR